MPASILRNRPSLHVCQVIASTRTDAKTPTGWYSSLRPSDSSVRASGFSLGSKTSFARSPCFNAFRETVTFPAGDLGPVENSAFRRFAAILLFVVIFDLYQCQDGNAIKGFCHMKPTTQESSPS